MAEYVYVDESGPLADSHCPIITLAAIKTSSPKALRWIIKRAMRRVQRKKPGSPEPKFHNVTDNTRAAVLEALAKEQVEILELSVFKGAQTIPHTPANYAVLLVELLRMCGVEHQAVAELVVDKPFNVLQRRIQLTAIVRERIELGVALHYADSVNQSSVQLADFAAGAVHAKHTGRNLIFYQLIQPRVVSDQFVTWGTLRREWTRRN